ncbi:MAG: L,D-transpeptidase [Sphingomonadales bacterium]
MDLVVSGDGVLEWRGKKYRCTVGRGGVTSEKREGDGATPRGSFLMRRVLYRPDRHACPEGGLPADALRQQDGWCDDPRDPKYNRQVTLPYPARCESLWRHDGRYDYIVVIGHNDDPVTPGAGSAVFVHVAAPDYGATAGCVALSAPDLVEILRTCDPSTRLRIL